MTGCNDECLGAGDVSRAWLVWSSAAETALADAYQFAGGPVPERCLIMGRGTARMRTVRFGGPMKRPYRRNVADAQEGGEVFLNRNSSAAPLLDLRRRLKAVMDVPDVMIRDGVSLARSEELTVQWDGILRVGPIGPVTREDFQAGESRRLAGDLHCRLSDFIHRVVVHRGDEAIRGWRNWLREDPLVHPHRWLSPAPFLQCKPHRCLLILPGQMRNAEKPGFPTFVVLGKGTPALRNSLMRLMVGCPCFLWYLCLNLLGKCLLRLHVVKVPPPVVWMVGVGRS